MIEVTVSPARLPVGAADLEILLTNRGQNAYLNVIFTVKLPVGVMRLRGSDRITVSRLAPGQSIALPMRVRTAGPGRYQVTSPNFSYRDHTGHAHREHALSAEFVVVASSATEPESEPNVFTELMTSDLPLGEWSAVRARVRNDGDVDVQDLEVTLSGQVTADNRTSTFVLARLPADSSVDASFFVRAQEAGEHVPIHLDLFYRGPRGGHATTVTRTVSVHSDDRTGLRSVRESNPVVKILFCGANPVGTSRLRIDEEIREIQQVIKQGKERDNILVHTEWAVRPRDIIQALIDFQPNFVHFAGHGGGNEGSFAAEDDVGHAHVIPVDGLVQAFRAVGQEVQCVVVNACQTQRLAQALTAVIPCVVGMREPVGDRSAIRFSIGFYQALAGGKRVGTAFDVGVAQLMMAPGSEDVLAPILLHAGDAGEC